MANVRERPARAEYKANKMEHKETSRIGGQNSIGDFRVAFHLCFKANPSAKPYIWKLVLFSCKVWFIYM